MADRGWAAAALRTDVAHPARVYDCWLGGKDNFAVDREVAQRVVDVIPETPQSVRANRAFLGRAVRFAAEAGIDQFVDIGSGLPTVENTHEIAQRAAPDAHVVYVDNDPIVVAHSRAVLGGTGSVVAVHGDLRRPEGILGNPDLRRHIDLGRPVAVLLLGVVHLVTDNDDPAGIVARIAASMVPGSFLILSHLTADSDPRRTAQLTEIVNGGSGGVVATPRTREQVEGLFAGFELLDPGVVAVDRWRPGGAGQMDTFWLWGGVGRRL